MDLQETNLPGVGKKFKLQIDHDSHLIIIVHNTGKREVFLDNHPDEDNIKLFELNDRQSRLVGSILEGAYYVPQEMETMSTQLDDQSIIEWYTLNAGNHLIGRSLQEVNRDHDIDIQVIACKQEDDSTTISDPQNVLHEGDIIITVGSRDQHRSFKKFLGE